MFVKQVTLSTQSFDINQFFFKFQEQNLMEEQKTFNDCREAGDFEISTESKNQFYSVRFEVALIQNGLGLKPGLASI